MWIVAAVLLLSSSVPSSALTSEVNQPIGQNVGYLGVDDLLQDEGSGESSEVIPDIFSFTSSQSPSGDEVENPGSIFTSPQPGNVQKFALASGQDKVYSTDELHTPTDQQFTKTKTQGSKSGRTAVHEVEFRDSPATNDDPSKTVRVLPKIRQEPRYRAVTSTHRRLRYKLLEEMETPDDESSFAEVSEDDENNMEYDDDDDDDIYTLAHFRYELYAHVEDQVSAINKSTVELVSYLQQKISQLENQLTENMAYTSVLETKIRVSATPQRGDIRLLSSDSCGRVSRAGYLLFYTGTTWGFVCDDFFNAAAVKVACAQLGYPGPASAQKFVPGMSPSALNTQMKKFWQDSYQIVLDDVQCTGEEVMIDSCRHFDLGKHDCSMDEIVYLSC